MSTGRIMLKTKCLNFKEPNLCLNIIDGKITEFKKVLEVFTSYISSG